MGVQSRIMTRVHIRNNEKQFIEYLRKIEKMHIENKWDEPRFNDHVFFNSKDWDRIFIDFRLIEEYEHDYSDKKIYIFKRSEDWHKHGLLDFDLFIDFISDYTDDEVIGCKQYEDCSRWFYGENKHFQIIKKADLKKERGWE